MLGNENTVTPWQVVGIIVGFILLIVFMGTMSGCEVTEGFAVRNNCLEITYKTGDGYSREVYDIDEMIKMLHKYMGKQAVYFQVKGK